MGEGSRVVTAAAWVGSNSGPELLHAVGMAKKMLFISKDFFKWAQKAEHTELS